MLRPRMSLPRVVVDGTPLRGSSGHRGIGRFIFDLLHGLEQTRDEWGHKLDVQVVEALDWRRTRVVPGLAEAADALFAARGTEGAALVHRRRLLLDVAASRHGADLLHLTEALGTPVSRVVPRVVTCHDLIPLRMPRQYLKKVTDRLTQESVDRRRYESAQRIVAISERTRVDLREILGIRADVIDVVPNGIDLSSWVPVPRDDDAARLRKLGVGERPFVVYVGYWDHRKDVPAMLRAVAAARRRADVELVWAGHLDERDFRKLREYLKREGALELLSGVRFVGFVSAEDLAALYRHAAAHVFLSRLEGFGLSVAEAMGCGCPVIVARDSGSDSVGGDAAMIVTPGDATAAGDAIVRLVEDRDERARRGRAGVARAGQFERRVTARGYVDVWRRTLATLGRRSNLRASG